MTTLKIKKKKTNIMTKKHTRVSCEPPGALVLEGYHRGIDFRSREKRNKNGPPKMRD